MVYPFFPNISTRCPSCGSVIYLGESLNIQNEEGMEICDVCGNMISDLNKSNR